MPTSAPVTSTGVSEDAQLRIMAAKIISQARWPYLSTLLFTLRSVPSKDLPTLAVDDGWRMYYNEEFVLQQTPEILATMVLHEAMHCVSKHGPRFQSLHQEPSRHNIWNLAGDANINSVLDESKMPWGEFDPVRYESLSKYGVKVDMTTETAYFTIVEYFEKHPEEMEQVSDCGSVMGGGARAYEIPRSDENSPAVKRDHQDVIRDRVAQDVLNHAGAKGIGSVPGALLRWANELLNPKIDWRRTLAGAFRTSLATVLGRKDYTYTRPSRRQGAMTSSTYEIILPAMRKPAPPPIAIVVDTSGSISNQEITDFLSEIEGIAKTNGVSQGLTVIPCDAEIGEIQKLRSISSIGNLRISGGGGTDLRVGIAAAAKLKQIPRIIIVLTDGYTPWPEELPAKVDALIVCCSTSEGLIDIPNFARTIDMTVL